MALRLIDYLDPELVILQSSAATKEEIIRELSARFERLGYVKPSYTEAVLKREALMPTGLPLERKDNVAIPHTDPEHVIKAAVGLATLSAPIAFANMEDPEETLPVSYVFLLAIDDKNAQIETLQQIMLALQSGKTLDLLGQARGFEDLSLALSA